MNWLKRAACGLLWLAAAAVGGAEGFTLWGWAAGRRYLERFGWAENPYVAEDVSNLGVLALFLLCLFLLLLFFAAVCTHQLRQRRKSDEHETIDDP